MYDGNTYTSAKPSDQVHTLRIGWFTYNVSFAAGDSHLILTERNIPSQDAPIPPDLAQKLLREVIWETYADVDNKNGSIDTTDRNRLYILPSNGGVKGELDKTDINRDGIFDIQDELVLAAMVERQKHLRIADVNQDGKWNQDDVVKYERFLKDGINWDIDGDGIPYRTVIGNAHPKSAFFSRGTGHDEYARYSEDNVTWEKGIKRLGLKYETAKKFVPTPCISKEENAEIRILSFGSTDPAIKEAIDQFHKKGIR